MKIVIDSKTNILSCEGEGGAHELALYSPEAFTILSREWLRVGWALRYYHTFSWLGRPILQLPDDLLRVQEVICSNRPDAIIETGVFDGGSLLFHATICETLGNGRVIGVDKFVSDDTRAALRNNRLSERIALVEGDSTDPHTVDQVKKLLPGSGSVMVILDSNHTADHVRRELEWYAPLVTPGSYIVVADGVMRDLTDVPGGDPTWADDNPAAAARAFAHDHPEFELRQPDWKVHDSPLTGNVTYWADGWLRRKPE